MKLNSYFKNLPNRWSANFLAMLGFVNLIFVLFTAIFPSIYELLDFRNNNYFFITLYLYGYSSIIFGITSILAAVTLSIPFYKILKSLKPKTMIILFIILIFITLAIVTCITSICYHNTGITGLIQGFALAESIEIYLKNPLLFLLVFLSLPFLCIYDSTQNVQMTNPYLAKNKVYRIFINTFFCYFWLMYIPFMLELLILLSVNIHSIHH